MSKWYRMQQPGPVVSTRKDGELLRTVTEVVSPKDGERWWQVHIFGDGFSLTLELETFDADGEAYDLEAVQELADDIGDTPVAFYELPLRRRNPTPKGEN